MCHNIRKFIAIIILITFVTTSVKSPAYGATPSISLTTGAQSVMPWMPKPGVMISLSPPFEPATLKGMIIHPEDSLKFDFIINRGDDPLSLDQKKSEYNKLIKYFLASLTTPDDHQWVNLSPYEKDRIIKDDFGKTEMGRDALAQDYILKQITSSLIYPESKLGKTFWEKVYSKAQAQFGTTNVPMNTFNKVWIVPDQAVVYEKGNIVYLEKSHLKVMLEEDYLSLEKHSNVGAITNRPMLKGRLILPVGRQEPAPTDTHSMASNIVREIVLPELEREVNEGKNFAPLRQIFSGVILAVWYKQALKESLLGKIYANKSKVKGVDTDPASNQEIYKNYLKAFKKGVFNYIKEDVDKLTNEKIPRKYFSGGLQIATAAMNVMERKVGYGSLSAAMSKTDIASAAMKTAGEEARATQPASAAMKKPRVQGYFLPSISVEVNGSNAAIGDAWGRTYYQYVDQRRVSKRFKDVEIANANKAIREEIKEENDQFIKDLELGDIIYWWNGDDDPMFYVISSIDVENKRIELYGFDGETGKIFDSGLQFKDVTPLLPHSIVYRKDTSNIPDNLEGDDIKRLLIDPFLLAFPKTNTPSSAMRSSAAQSSAAMMSIADKFDEAVKMIGSKVDLSRIPKGDLSALIEKIKNDRDSEIEQIYAGLLEFMKDRLKILQTFKGQIFIVDDSSNLTNMLKLLLPLKLPKIQKPILEAVNAKEALEVLKDPKLNLNNIVVITDINMGGTGLDGDDLVKEIRKDPKLSNLPILVQTGLLVDNIKDGKLDALKNEAVIERGDINHMLMYLAEQIEKSQTISAAMNNNEKLVGTPESRKLALENIFRILGDDYGGMERIFDPSVEFSSIIAEVLNIFNYRFAIKISYLLIAAYISGKYGFNGAEEEIVKFLKIKDKNRPKEVSFKRIEMGREIVVNIDESALLEARKMHILLEIVDRKYREENPSFAKRNMKYLTAAGVALGLLASVVGLKFKSGNSSDGSESPNQNTPKQISEHEGPQAKPFELVSFNKAWDQFNNAKRELDSLLPDWQDGLTDKEIQNIVLNPENVISHYAENPNTPKEVLAAIEFSNILKDLPSRSKILSDIWANPNLDQRRINDLIRSTDPKEMHGVSKNKALTPEQMRELYNNALKYKDLIYRVEGLLLNEKLPSDILKEILPKILNELKLNKDERLSGLKDVELMAFLKFIAQRQNLGENQRQVLIEVNKDLMRILAQNPNVGYAEYVEYLLNGLKADTYFDDPVKNFLQESFNQNKIAIDAQKLKSVQESLKEKEQEVQKFFKLNPRLLPKPSGDFIKDINSLLGAFRRATAIAIQYQPAPVINSPATKGGIDLNAAMLNLQIKRDGKGVPLPFSQQDIAQLNKIEGLVPQILEIMPATRFPLLAQLP